MKKGEIKMKYKTDTEEEFTFPCILNLMLEDRKSK